MDPERVTKAGARLLADYLEYADSGGTAAQASGGAELNPFEADVRDRLAACGITVVPQYGVGGYRVDFAAAHPADTGRMVLAIEADGASYRESGSVRDRDRLRGEHLQRLGWGFHRLWSTNWFQNPASRGGQAARRVPARRGRRGSGRGGSARRGVPASHPGVPWPRSGHDQTARNGRQARRWAPLTRAEAPREVRCARGRDQNRVPKGRVS